MIKSTLWVFVLGPQDSRQKHPPSDKALDSQQYRRIFEHCQIEKFLMKRGNMVNLDILLKNKIQAELGKIRNGWSH
ncbi:hypothetical protein, partial [Plectonema radiosum]|uniref:hypothetical protein n=1 Tax=Plectonema radiosum TaxID=945768 RepID=UPI0021E85190